MSPRRVDLRLLRRDELELGRMATAFRHGARFGVIACREDLGAAAKKELVRSLNEHGKTWTVETTLVEDADTVPRMLARLSPAPPETVVALSPGEETAAILDVLNLHRERLRAEGARFALWLDGREGLRSCVERAPDLYSFRDAVAVIEGAERQRAAVVEEEPERLRMARAAVDRRKDAKPLVRADALRGLAMELRTTDREDEADRIIVEGLDVIASQQPRTDEHRILIAKLIYERNSLDTLFSSAQAREMTLSGLEALEGGTSPDALQLRAILLSTLKGPPEIVYDLSAAQEAYALAQETDFDPFFTEAIKMNLGRSLLARGDVIHARRHLLGCREAVGVVAWNRGLIQTYLGEVEVEAGRWKPALDCFGKALDGYAAAGAPRNCEAVGAERAELLAKTGELSFALGVLDVSSETSGDLKHTSSTHGRLLARSRIELALGRVRDALETARRAVSLAEDHALADEHLSGVKSLVHRLKEAWTAGAIDEAEVDGALKDLLVAQEIGVAMGGSEPPWYRVLYRRARGDLLGVLPRRREDAIKVMREAFSIATGGCIELSAGVGRRLASLLGDEGRKEEATELLDRCEALADEHHLFTERCEISAVRLRVAVQSSGTGAVLNSRIQALREACEATGSVLTKARLFLESGRFLVEHGEQDLGRPLLHEARRIYRDLPWPEQEGRCLEALENTVLARARYKQFGLELRLRSLGSR